MEVVAMSFKKQVGAALVHLRTKNGYPPAELVAAIKYLEDAGLARFRGTRIEPGTMMSIAEYSDRVISASQAYYELTGHGEALVAKHTDAQLLAGKFALPLETKWYDRWPWKIVWPAVVSLITGVIGALIVHGLTKK